MSDANLINPSPIECVCNGATYTFAACDLDVELLFQTAHERWTINRLETARGGVSLPAFDLMAQKIAEQIAANKFAFGGLLSWQFLFSAAGMVEYLSLLAGKVPKRPGGPATTSRAFQAARRADPDGFERMWKKVVERDFPNPTDSADPSCEGPETPSPSTTESSSSFAAAPG